MIRLRETLLGSVLALAAVCCSSPDATPDADKKDDVRENHPGTLVITSPSRAAFIGDDGKPVEVIGSGASKALTIDGQPADVAADGTFHATVTANAGLNIVVAQDGDARLETPFLYGHFAKADQMIAQAIAVDVGPSGISAPLPAASLMSVTNGALKDRDLLGAIRGQTMTGTISGANWTFTVTAGHNGTAAVALAAGARGLGVDATVDAVSVDGHLSIKALGLTYGHDVRISVDRAELTGDVELHVDQAKGALGAAMPAADIKLQGFKFDTDNAGFPCCVDSILTGIVKPRIESAIRDGIREEVPKLVQLTLTGVGVPKELDFSLAGISAHIPIATQFDGVFLDDKGANLTAAVRFGGAFAAGTPGAAAPGWIQLGKPYEPTSRAPSLGVSFSLDAVNQLMFAAWGTGSVAFVAPAPIDAKLTPMLPPVVTVASAGTLRVALGEIVIQKNGAPGPMAAVTVMQDVAPTADHDGVVLTPKGEPTISITWMGDGDPQSGANLIAGAAKDQLAKFLKPFHVPLPKIALDGLGAGFAGKSLSVQASSLVVDAATARVGVTGAAVLTP